MRLENASSLSDHLRAGTTVFCAGGAGHPRRLVAGLSAHPEATRGSRVVWTRPAGFSDAPPSVPQGSLEVYFGANDLDGAAGEVRIIPMQYRRLYDYLAQEVEPDVALLQLAPPDEAGLCRYGLGVDFFPAVRGRSRLLAVELNHALPRLPGAPGIPWSEIDLVLESEEPPPTLASRTDTVAARIGAQAAALIRDGDCVQTGVGAVPDAILAALASHRDLGCHTGLFSNGMRALAESGALTGRRKPIDRGCMVTGFLLGDDELYRWAASRPDLLLRPVDYTHDARVLARLDGLVTINSAIEVDLFGQVNAERLGGRLVSGPGGAVDFARGAALARGGRSLVALPATAAGGRVSRIVASLSTPATVLGSDIDAVVTEHGVAWLRGRTPDERADALIAVAAPSAQAELALAWQERVARRRPAAGPKG